MAIALNPKVLSFFRLAFFPSTDVVVFFFCEFCDFDFFTILRFLPGLLPNTLGPFISLFEEWLSYRKALGSVERLSGSYAPPGMCFAGVLLLLTKQDTKYIMRS